MLFLIMLKGQYLMGYDGIKNVFSQMMAAASYQSGEIKPKQPILLLNGLGDRLVSPAYSEAIHKKWQLELHRHPWAGHDLTLDDGEWVVLQLKNWVSGMAN